MQGASRTTHRATAASSRPPGGTSTCNGRAATNSTAAAPVQLTVTYPTAGIFGWKKRALYFLLILLMSVVVINMVLTCWIIKILDLTSEGLGKMIFTKAGIAVQSDAEFLSALSAREIVSRERQGLKLESSRNVTILAKDKRRRITNVLSLGESGFQAMGNSFSVHDPTGGVLLHIDPKEMVVAANHLLVSESGGLRLDGFLQTSLVRGGPTKDLRLGAPLKSVRVRSEDTLRVESPAGGISSISFKDMKLKSTGGAVNIDGSRLEMKNLKLSRSVHDNGSERNAYQVCMCDNGRVFLAHREGHCQIQESFCRDKPSRTREEPSWSKSRIS